MEAERLRSNAPPLEQWDCEFLPRCSNAEYDRLLSENIVFVDLVDAVANNTVVECIARNTPVLVNPLPNVVDYLGPDYPFYFRSLEEAASKAEDYRLLQAAHQYLVEMPKEWLKGETFCKELEASALYRSLPAAPQLDTGQRSAEQFDVRVHGGS
jgi:hypothetical protein